MTRKSIHKNQILIKNIFIFKSTKAVSAQRDMIFKPYCSDHKLKLEHCYKF